MFNHHLDQSRIPVNIQEAMTGMLLVLRRWCVDNQGLFQEPTDHPARGVVQWALSSGGIVSTVLRFPSLVRSFFDVSIFFGTISSFDHAQRYSCCTAWNKLLQITCYSFSSALCCRHEHTFLVDRVRRYLGGNFCKASVLL